MIFVQMKYPIRNLFHKNIGLCSARTLDCSKINQILHLHFQTEFPCNILIYYNSNGKIYDTLKQKPNKNGLGPRSR